MKAFARFTVPLKLKDFRLLWIGQTVSGLGDAAQSIALAWLVLNLTGSALAVSGALLAIILPRVALVLIGGVITDLQDGRTVMLWSDTVRAGTIGLIAILAFVQHLSMPILYGILLIYGAAGGIFFPASYSIVPQLVPSDELQAANSLNSLTSQLTLVLGAPIAGVLVALAGPAPAIAFNALSFGIAAIFTAQMSTPERPKHSSKTSLKSNPSPLTQARAGLAYVASQKWLLALLVMNALSNFAVSGLFAIGLPLLAHRNTSIGVQGLGILLAGFGVGSIAGLLLVGLFPRLRRRGVVLCFITLLKAPLYGGLSMFSLPIAVTALAVTGLLNGIDEVAYTGLVQEEVSSTILGRVMGVVALATFGLQPVSQLITGIVASVVKVQILFLSAGLIILLSSLGGFLTTSLRKID